MHPVFFLGHREAPGDDFRYHLQASPQLLQAAATLSSVLQFLCCFIHHNSLVAIPLTALTSSFPFSGCQPLKSPSRPSTPGYLCPYPPVARPWGPAKGGGGCLWCGRQACLASVGRNWSEAHPMCLHYLMPVTGTEELQQQPLNVGGQYGSGGVVALARGCQITIPDLGWQQELRIHLNC